MSFGGCNDLNLILFLLDYALICCAIISSNNGLGKKNGRDFVLFSVRGFGVSVCVCSTTVYEQKKGAAINVKLRWYYRHR